MTSIEILENLVRNRMHAAWGLEQRPKLGRAHGINEVDGDDRGAGAAALLRSFLRLFANGLDDGIRLGASEHDSHNRVIFDPAQQDIRIRNAETAFKKL